jgi:K+/H+ antiporter YhaU regulatory subunit KhtT
VDGIETIELYMEDHAAWIGQTLADLQLQSQFDAHVIGVRRATGEFSYAPPDTYTVQKHDALIIVMPMANADRLHTATYGANKRPNTLRHQYGI